MNISIAIYLHCFCFVFIPAIEFNDSLWWLLRFNIAQVLRRSDEVVGFFSSSHSQGVVTVQLCGVSNTNNSTFQAGFYI